VANGIRLSSVSMGKGFVEWQVVYPSLAQKNEDLQARYGDLRLACEELKRHCSKGDVDPETVALADREQPDLPWSF